MDKYDILVRILDELRNEAPTNYRRYYPAENEKDLMNQARSRSFIHLFFKVRYGLDVFTDRENFITDDPYDGGIDAYYIDKERKEIILIQSKFRDSKDNFENKEIDMTEILKMDIFRITKGEKQDRNGHEYNKKIRAMQKIISEIGDIGRYNYRVVILANLKRVDEEDLFRLTGGVPAEVFDYEKCYTNLVFPIVAGCCFNADEIRINLSLSNKEGNDGRIVYFVQTEYSKCKIMVLFVPVLEIAKLMDKFKNSILKYNPRCYLSLKENNINTKIEKTIVDKTTNEFALYNNGITILSDGTEINSQIGIKDQAQMMITNPQIINGGQTAYTLSCIYRDHKDNLSVFEEKEVMVKVITFLDDNIEEKKRRALIEELSKATNEQSPVNEADRRANDSMQIHYQDMIYKEFGYFYDRKRGEFYDGEEKNYIDSGNIVNRSVFIRIAASVKGDAAKARRNGDDTLFRKESFEELFKEKNDYRIYMFGFFCHQYLNEIERKYEKSANNKFGINTYGNALRYGKYAVVNVVCRKFDPALSPDQYQREARSFTDAVLKKWLSFESYITSKLTNWDYFNYTVEEDGRTSYYHNFDGYYKGRTVNEDIKNYSFWEADLAGQQAAAAVEQG